MEIRPDEIIYEKTGDKDIFTRYELGISEVYLSKLKEQIIQLEEALDNMPDVLNPDDYPNDFRDLILKLNSLAPDKTRMEETLQIKKDLVILLEGL